MGGPRGPQAKDPATLLRRNKATTAQVLDAKLDNGKWPPLPPQFEQRPVIDEKSGLVIGTKAVRIAYQRRTREWYAGWRKTPQAQALLWSDREELARTAILVDRIYSGRDVSAGAFRAVDSSMSRFGATLQDRWRLKLSLDRGDAGQKPTPAAVATSMEARRAERERLAQTAP